jgi:hypothetical protein
MLQPWAIVDLGASLLGCGSMRKNINNSKHDPRSIDLAVIITLLAFVLAICAVVTESSKGNISATTIGTTVRW